jgi:2-methylcitrate dehydratase PrpD
MENGAEKRSSPLFRSERKKTMPSLSEQLSDYFCQLQLQDLPEEKIHDIKRLILDYLGVAARGSTSPAGRLAIAFAENQHSAPQATIIGSPHRCAPMLAAFANAVSNHSIEMDDVDHLALFHFSSPVVSAALAIAEKVGASGEALLTAVYAGCELMARLSTAMNPSLRNRGFHTTPVCGVFGAALAAGRLLKSSPKAVSHGLGLSGSMSAGLMEFYGRSLQKRFNPGPAAQNGVMAAELAHSGFSGSSLIFEGERGFLNAFTDRFDASALTRGLGHEFPVYIEFKRYACARPIHNAVDCALSIRATSDIDPGSLKKIQVSRHPDWAHYHQLYSPSNINEAQVSLPYSVAVAFKEGDAFLDQYDERLLKNSDIQALMAKIRVKAEASLPEGVSCKMVVETLEGREISSQVDHPKGSLGNPLTDAELIQKAKWLSAVWLEEAAMERVAEAVFGLEKQSALDALLKPFRRERRQAPRSR